MLFGNFQIISIYVAKCLEKRSGESMRPLRGVLRKHGVDGRLYFCSDVCVRDGRVKSRPFTVSVGLRQRCVLSPLLFIVNISSSQLFLWMEPNPDVRFCWRASLTFFNTIQFTRFILQQNEVCYTKYQTFYWKTVEGHTKGAWEPNAVLRTGVENHWSTWIG